MSLITLETNHPGAIDSPDHLCPHGCIRDNFSSLGLIGEITEYFGGKQISVLDLGCAGGQFVVDFIKQGDIAVGLEGSSHALTGSGQANWKNYHNSNLFLCDISEDYQIYNDGNPMKFDFIHSEEVFEHIGEDKIDNLLINIRKHLKPQGVCAFAISMAEDVQERDGKQYILHQSVFPASWWIEKLENNGFQILTDGRNDNVHFGYIFNSTVRWSENDRNDLSCNSLFVCCKLKNND